MKRPHALWAPWRLGYVRGLVKSHEKGGPACFLCAAVKGPPRRDRAALVVERRRLAFCVLNKFPYHNGHLMFVPNRHVADFVELSRSELAQLMGLAVDYVKALKKTLNPHGFNLGINVGRAAGAGLDTHLHFHLVPRWHADTNFMPMLADTRIISQSLQDLYVRLKAARGRR